MEKFNFSYDFQTEQVHSITVQRIKKSQRKIVSNKDAKTCHFHYFPEM